MTSTRNAAMHRRFWVSGTSQGTSPLSMALALIVMASTPATTLLAQADAQAAAAVEALELPTANDHLFKDDAEKFYMYVYRNFEGQESRPWSGGKYGFVRSLRRTTDGVIGTKFHEGIDIKPMQRDRHGNPLDKVCSIADGIVVHTNHSSGKSSYGKYVVIKHPWQCGPFYSLYAHLSDITVSAGQKIGMGQAMGRLGYTGAGINRDRAHLHLELGILLSTRFHDWHGIHFRSPNHHGIYNGINMAGLDIASLYMARKKNPGLSIPQFVKSTPVHYRVTIPRDYVKKGSPEILSRYPWLASGAMDSRWASLEIAFSASGFPVSISPSSRVVRAPAISSIRSCKSRHEYYTKGFVSGTGQGATLSQSGQRFIQLLCGRF